MFSYNNPPAAALSYPEQARTRPRRPPGPARAEAEPCLRVNLLRRVGLRLRVGAL